MVNERGAELREIICDAAVSTAMRPTTDIKQRTDLLTWAAETCPEAIQREIDYLQTHIDELRSYLP